MVRLARPHETLRQPAHRGPDQGDLVHRIADRVVALVEDVDARVDAGAGRAHVVLVVAVGQFWLAGARQDRLQPRLLGHRILQRR